MLINVELKLTKWNQFWEPAAKSALFFSGIIAILLPVRQKLCYVLCAIPG